MMSCDDAENAVLYDHPLGPLMYTRPWVLMLSFCACEVLQSQDTVVTGYRPRSVPGT